MEPSYQETCADCGTEVGLHVGRAAFYDGGETFCPKCSGRAASVCSGCGVSFVDIGIGRCPFCTSAAPLK